MGKDHDFNNKNSEDLKDDLKNFFKHSKKTIRNFLGEEAEEVNMVDGMVDFHHFS